MFFGSVKMKCGRSNAICDAYKATPPYVMTKDVKCILKR